MRMFAASDLDVLHSAGTRTRSPSPANWRSRSANARAPHERLGEREGVDHSGAHPGGNVFRCPRSISFPRGLRFGGNKIWKASTLPPPCSRNRATTQRNSVKPSNDSVCHATPASADTATNPVSLECRADKPPAMEIFPRQFLENYAQVDAKEKVPESCAPERTSKMRCGSGATVPASFASSQFRAGDGLTGVTAPRAPHIAKCCFRHAFHAVTVGGKRSSATNTPARH